MTVRIVAIGFLLACWYMQQFAIPFMKGVAESEPYFAFGIAIKSISEPVWQMNGMGMIIPAAFITGCLGLGLLTASVLASIMVRIEGWGRQKFFKQVQGGFQ